MMLCCGEREAWDDVKRRGEEDGESGKEERKEEGRISGESKKCEWQKAWPWRWVEEERVERKRECHLSGVPLSG